MPLITLGDYFALHTTCTRDASSYLLILSVPTGGGAHEAVIAPPFPLDIKWTWGYNHIFP